MLELLNIRFTFSLRTSHQNQDGKSAIVLRVSKANAGTFLLAYIFWITIGTGVPLKLPNLIAGQVR